MAAPRSVGLARLVVAALVFSIGLNGVIPLFSLYAEEFPLTTGDKTLVFGVYSLCVIPGSILFGAVSDAYGRHVVLVPAFVGAIVAALVLAAADDLGSLVIARVLQGVVAGAFWGPIGAFARDLTPDERRNDAMLLVSTTAPLGTALGLLLFGIVGARTDSTVTPWLVYAVLMAPVVVMLATIPDRRARTGRRPRLTIGVPPGARRVFVAFLTPVMFSVAVSCAFCLSLAPDLLQSAGGSTSPAVGGAAAAGIMTVSFAAQMVTRRVAMMERLGLIAVASAVVGCVALATPFGARLGGLTVALLLIGVSFGLGFRAVLVIGERSSTVSTRAATIAACVVVQYIGAGAGPLIMGRLADATSVTVSLLAIAATGMLATTSATWYVLTARPVTDDRHAAASTAAT